MKICFVCTGNICRSAMAQVIFTNLCKKNKRTDIVVESAGVNAIEGADITTEGKTALKDCKEKLPKVHHFARQWTDKMIGYYDYVICMTARHKHAICAGRISPLPINVTTLDEWAHCGDIEDPWQRGDDIYFAVCKKLQTALKLLYKEVIK